MKIDKDKLEVLEALYMRPGYPIMLEWGWDPYIVGNFSENVLNANGQIYKCWKWGRTQY